MPISSFFSYVWTNPFASLPFGSLSTDLQRRFLSWVLKRSLGRFVRAGGLDVERIQSQIGQGKVEIEGLELDTDVSVLSPTETAAYCRRSTPSFPPQFLFK